MITPYLHVEHLSHRYGHKQVVADVSFAVDGGSIACLLGASGCGKTTILRCLAGFERPTGGRTTLNGMLLDGSGHHLPAERRGIGMVFQDYALFPHLTVAANIGFGLHALTGDQRRRRVTELLELIGLAALGGSYPHQLSGGQQQRVALARALAPRPQLLLLDEPFSNLDVDLRRRLSQDVRRLLKHEGTTAILVTHDQDEAFAMADQVGVVHAGSILQWAAPYALYHEPATRFVADFIGEGCLIAGSVLNAHRVAIELGEVAGTVPAECEPGCIVDVLVRPDDIVHDDSSPILARVLDKSFRGAEFLYVLQLDSGATVLSLVPSHHNHAIGEKIGIRHEIDHLIIFAR